MTALAGLGLRAWEYSRFVSHDPAADAAIPFDPALARCVTVEVAADGLRWPRVDGRWDAALLELRVRSHLAGRVRDPGLVVGAGDGALRQHFERGVRGRRFVNLSALAAARPRPGESLALAGLGLGWETGPTCLWLFDNPVVEGSTLVVAAHPDDAEIAAFSFYSRSDTWVVTLTAGEASRKAHPPVGSDAAAQRAFVGRLRSWDSLVVPFLGGVPPARTLQLGYADGSLAALRAAPEQPQPAGEARQAELRGYRALNLSPLALPAREAATWHALVADLRFLVAALRPATVVAPHPLVEAHPDHRVAALAVAEALRANDWRGGRLLLYTARPASSWHFPEGDRDAEVGLPPWFAPERLGQRVVSRPLSVADRERKHLALRSMHDLGLPAPAADTPLALVRRQADEWYGLLFRPDRSYFRRAVRPSEVFFAIDAEQVPEYFARFARHLEPAP